MSLWPGMVVDQVRLDAFSEICVSGFGLFVLLSCISICTVAGLLVELVHAFFCLRSFLLFFRFIYLNHAFFDFLFSLLA